MLREKQYERKNWRSVIHMTWDPGSSEVIRIHMVPPRFLPFRKVPSIAILNGQELLPLNEAWAILFTEFANAVNAHGAGEMSEEDLAGILDRTFAGVKKVYPQATDEMLKEDLLAITDTFRTVVRGEIPEVEIGGLSLAGYAKNMTAPHRMDLMVSAMTVNGAWHCNQKCLHCYAADQKLSEVPELSTGEWKKIIAACRKAKIPQLTFTGGEPTLRADLCELIKEARWFVTRLNTNGVLLSPELCANLKEAELDSVQVTFYSDKEAVHNELVGADNYKKTVDGIKNALAAGLNLSINTPLCTKNREYWDTLKFLHALGVTYVTCSGLIVTGNARKEESERTQLAEEELYRILEDAAAYCYANGMEIAFTSPGWIAEEKLLAIGLSVPSCGACLSNMAIAPDGRVIPCQSWLDEKPLGDMRTESFKKIWNRAASRKHRAYAAKNKKSCPLRERGEKQK